jgi:hypothetical protein
MNERTATVAAGLYPGGRCHFSNASGTASIRYIGRGGVARPYPPIGTTPASSSADAGMTKLQIAALRMTNP